MLDHVDPGDGQPGFRRLRGGRRPVHLDRRALGGVVLRSWRQADGQQCRLQVHLPLLLRRRAVRQRLHHVWPQVTTNKKVGVMWPNDADGNAIRSALGPAAHQGRATPSSTPVPTPMARTTTRRRSRSSSQPTARSSTPSRSRQTLRRSGSRRPSRATSRRSRRSPRPDSSPRRSRRLGAIGVGLGERRVLDSDLPLHVLADRGDARSGSGDGYRTASGKQWNQQLGASLALFDAGNGALKAVADPHGQDGGCRPRSARLAVMTPVGQPAVGQGPERQRRGHADHRWSVGQGAVRQQVQARTS